MDNEKDLYNTARIKKLNVGLKEEDDMIYERVSKNAAPVVRRQRPSFSRHTTLEVEGPSTPHQSRPIEEVNLSRQRKDERRNEIPSYARPSSYSRQSIPNEARPSSNRPIKAQRPVRPNEVRPSNARPSNAQRPVRPNEVRPSNARPSNAQRPIRPNEVRPSNERPVNAQRPVRPNDPRQVRPNYERFDDNRSYNREKINNSNEITRDPNEIKMPRNLKKRGGFTGFKKFITIYSAILFAIIIAGMLVLNSFVKNYENNQPSNLAANIASNLTKDSLTYLNENKDSIACLENVDTIIEKSASLMGGEKVSYIENKEYRAENPSYDFTIDGNVVAQITFEKSKKGAFGLYSWKIKTLNIAEYIPDTMSYTLYAPEGATVSINDNPIEDIYKIADAAIPEHLQTASKFAVLSPYITYKVSGFINAPSVKATDANGNNLDLTMTSDTIVVGASTSSEFIEEVDGRVNGALEDWAKHFINYGGNLRNYIYDNCDWFAYIFGSDEINPIPTQFYDYEYISNIDFPIKETKNYIKYSKDCFSVDVKYEMTVNFYSDTFHDENQKLDATWIWFYDENSQEWYIVDCIYKN